MRYAISLSLLVAPLLFLVGCGTESREFSAARDRMVTNEKLTASSAAPRSQFESPGAEQQNFNTKRYDRIVENDFLDARNNPLSTFSIDVDTASYANMRRFLDSGQLPPPGAIRIEELINYFNYDYPQPEGDVPFSVNVELAGCPWNPAHRLARIGLQGREIETENRPPSNLVFLLDVSGSMNSSNKLGLVKSAMRMLVNQLNENDRVAIVVYAGASGLALPSTSADDRSRILTAFEELRAGGSTNGGEGIQLAYNIAEENFIPGGTNRVILCTDGDFNVGVTNQSELFRLIENRARSGVFLSVLGFGTGNYNDSTMEKLADRGNGNYAYIDSFKEATKVLVEQMSGTLLTIAKDVKIQVDFNPAHVSAYRLIGYENRMLKSEDFLDDTKDAGEIGAGHTVTALYEIVPVGVETNLPQVEASKYQASKEESQTPTPDKPTSNESFTVRLRYKDPEGVESKPLRVAVTDNEQSFEEASTDFRFATAVAGFGMLLRDSAHKGEITFEQVSAIAESSRGPDKHGYRSEFLQLITQASHLK